MKSLKITYKKPDALIPYANNARRHDEANVAEIAAAIERFGFLDPVAVDSSGVLVWGHGRVLAAKRLGLPEIPTISLPDNLTPSELKALRLSHNKLAEKSGWDMDKLAEELDALRVVDFDFVGTGFDTAEIERLAGDLDQLVAESAPTPTRTATEFTSADSGTATAPRTDEDGEQPAYDYPEEDLEDETPTSPAPKVSDDDYSEFSVIMRHPDKLDLLKTLGRIKEEHGFEQIAHALVYMREVYEQTRD